MQLKSTRVNRELLGGIRHLLVDRIHVCPPRPYYWKAHSLTFVFLLGLGDGLFIDIFAEDAVDKLYVDIAEGRL